MNMFLCWVFYVFTDCDVNDIVEFVEYEND